MTTRLILLAAALLCWAAPLQGQTIKAVAFNTTNNTVVSTNQISFTRLATVAGSTADPSFSVISGTNTMGLFSTSLIGIGPYLGFSHNGTRVFLISSNAIRAENPITFNNTTNAATTRTNLGLGSGLITNIVAGTNTLVFSNGILTGVNP
jgi:hypothetical protein